VNSSNGLGVDHVILTVGTDESDVDNPIRIVDPHHDPVLVAGDIEHCAAVLEDAR
jgi:hypothetical protein